MIPRFSNPHLLPQFTEIVSRSELYASGYSSPNDSTEYDADLSDQLNECIRHTLSVPDLAALSRKRKRSEDVEEHELNEEHILFRLVSSTLPPLPISTQPAPPPPSVTKEPDAEDNDVQALLRKQRSEAAAVDAETITRETRTVKSNGASTPSLHLRIASKFPQTNLMIIRTLQQPRKTRPPVPASSLSEFPYVPETSTISVSPVRSRTMDCPIIDAEQVNAALSTSSRRNRPRRRKHSEDAKERPPPQFWRPNPSWTGKCRGYAYGYPSNLACRLGTEGFRYVRDSMKKAVYS